jgi:hypothetical protein
MKAFNIKNLATGFLIASSFLFNACEKNSLPKATEQYAAILEVSADGTSTISDLSLKSALIATTAPDAAELAILAKMKDEEKLAHDVYVALYAKWNQTIFSRISVAESRHLDAVVLLLQNYGAGNTTIGAPGIFDNQDYAALYSTLVAKGSTSLADAYNVGAMIEEMDIKDLMDGSQQVKNENILMVFENLTRGSRNHLRAFNLQLSSLGLTYQPAYLDQTTFQAIVNGQFEKGKQYRINNGGGTCGAGYGFGK